MQFDETGNVSGKTLMLLPGTACDYQTNFGAVLDRLGEKYHLICVNYDGFDGSDLIFPDMITVTEKIGRYIKEEHGGILDGAIGSSLGTSFVGQLIQRELDRVTKPGGKIIVPTYVNREKTGETQGFVKAIDQAGADFKQQFTHTGYRAFLEHAGYRNIRTTLIEGRVPCSFAVIQKDNK